MSKESKWTVLAAIAALKKKDPAAFKTLLLDLNIERWQDMKENDYGPVIATCQAKLGIGKAEMKSREVIRELSTRDQFDKTGLDLNEKSEPGIGIDDDIKTVIEGAPNLAEGFARASKALFARRGQPAE